MKRIVVVPDVCGGKPVFEGTRITAQTVIDFLAAGDTIEDVLGAYPVLERADVLEALRYTSRILEHQFCIREVA